MCTTPHTTRGEIRAAVLPDDSPHVPRGLRVRCADRVAAIMADGMASTEDGRESGLIRPTRSRRWWRSSIDCGEGKGGAMAATNGGGANKAAAAGQTRQRRRDKQGGGGTNKAATAGTNKAAATSVRTWALRSAHDSDGVLPCDAWPWPSIRRRRRCAAACGAW